MLLPLLLTDCCLGVDKTVVVVVVFEFFIAALLLLFPTIVVDDVVVVVVVLLDGASENALLFAVGGLVPGAIVALFVGANENNVLVGVLVAVADDDDDVNENVGLDGGAMDAAAAAEDGAAKEMLANGFGLAGGSSCGADVDVAVGGARLANKTKGFEEGVGATEAPAAMADPAAPPKPNDLRETLIILRRWSTSSLARVIPRPGSGTYANRESSSSSSAAS